MFAIQVTFHEHSSVNQQQVNHLFVEALAPPKGIPSEAVAIVRGSGNVSGRITFRQNVPIQRTFITGEIIGLTPGLHGFHVHQLGNLTAGCLSTGPHYNPFKLNHSSHDALSRHAGDFGNILADQVSCH